MKLFLFILFSGFILNSFSLSIHSIVNFSTIAIVLLVIGLYASVYDIDIAIVKKHKQIVLSAITLGVFLKSVIIGSLFFLITKNPFAFLLGVCVAQIDPLSVTHLLKSKDGSFSSIGRTILRVWASFDDPMTILLSIFVVAPLTLGTFHTNSFAYLYEFALNLCFAFVIFVVQKYISGETSKKVLLLFCLLVAIFYNLTLGIAIIALFLRPKLGGELSHTVTIAFYVGVILLGITLEPSVQSFLYGVTLGTIAFGAQLIAAFLIAKKLTKSDKWHLALAQYNGITSIGLGIFFQQYFPTITSIIAFAVITINTLYYVMNNFVYKKVNRK